VAVDVTVGTEDRFADAVERTAYEVVVEAIAAAAVGASDHLDVRVAHTDDDLVIEIDGAGLDPVPRLADRVGALGGRITIGRSRLRVEIPCASS
jgi:hypothetical protein